MPSDDSASEEEGGGENIGETKRISKKEVAHVKAQIANEIWVVEKRDTTKRKGKISDAWYGFGDILDRQGVHQNYVQCLNCEKVYRYKKTTKVPPTSALTRHYNKCGEGPTPDQPRQVTDADKLEFKSACVRVMAMDLRPTTTFSTAEFQNLVQTACNVQARHGKVPLNAAQLISDRTTLVRSLEHEAGEARLAISEEMKAASEGSEDSVVGQAATTDLWTEKYSLHHFMSLTMHLINHNFKLHNLILSIAKFEDDSESGQNLADHLEIELLKFSVCKDNLVIVTDGGSNIIKALDILKIKRIYCMDHCLNVILKTAFNMKMVDLDLYGEDGQDIFKWVELAINFIRSTRRQKSEKLKKLKKPPLESTAEFPRYFSRVPCMKDVLENFDEVSDFLKAAHEDEIAQNLDKDKIEALVNFIQPLDLKAKPHSNDLADVDQTWLNTHITDQPGDSHFLLHLKENARTQLAGRHAVQLMQKCKKIVTLFKKWGANDLLDATLKQEIPTRWNSLLIMLMSFPKNDFAKINKILTDHNTRDKSYDHLLLTEADQKDIKTLIEFLEPWKVESERVQGDKGPTLHYVLAAAARLTSQCQQHDGDGFKIRHLRARAAQLLRSKFVPDVLHKVAAFLWPDFRHLRKLLKTSAERKEVFSEVQKMIEKFKDEEATHAHKKRKLNDGYDEWRAGGQERQGQGDGEEYDEIEEYLNAKLPLVEGEDILAFWEREAHRFPKLARLARQILCIPASSASSERAFSIAGIILSPRRTLLSSDHLQDMLVLRAYNLSKLAKERGGVVEGGDGEG